MSFGTVITGGVVSLTVTLNDALAVFPAPSVAEQLTLVVPAAKMEPDAGEQLTGTLPYTMSVALGSVYDTTAPASSVCDTVMFDGTLLITGGVKSVTVTLNEFVAESPAASWALQLTVVVPIANVAPDTGEQPDDVIVENASENETE